jgi:hypothetical protein
MNTLIDIPVRSTSIESYRLLIEINEHGTALMFFTKDPNVVVLGIRVVIFDENDNIDDVLSHLIIEIKKENPSLDFLHVFYNTKESMLIPANYYNETIIPDILSLHYGETKNSITATDRNENNGIYNIYRYNQRIDQLCNDNFTIHTKVHSSSYQLDLDKENDVLHAIIFYDSIKIILHKAGKLQIVQQYRYSSPDDVLYHVIHTCNQFDLSPSDVKLILSGMIVKDSILYRYLHNHFLNISFKEAPLEAIGNDDVENLPTHFFTHLIDLASCV